MYLTKNPLLTCSNYFQHGSSSKCNMNIVFYLPLVLYLAAPKKVALDTPVPAGVIIPRKTLVTCLRLPFCNHYFVTESHQKV